jgi:SAM-dependent methyltransferase
MDSQAIKKYISVIRRACDLLEQQLDEHTSDAFAEVINQVTQKPQEIIAPVIIAPTVQSVNTNPPVQNSVPLPTSDTRKKHIDALMGIDCWPPAIPQFQADAKPSELDMVHRANAVLDMSIRESVEGVRFLDYGCGDGYIASQMQHRGADSITGYDIVPSEHWEKLGNNKVNYTCDVNSLPAQGFDRIFLYDVLDHTVDPEGVMKHIKYLAAPGSIIYIRCHPWTSKHASHLPKFGLNKAYIHLFINYDELVNLGFKPLFTRVEKKPLEAYRWWFHEFKITKENPIYENVSDFFYVPSFKELLANEQGVSHEQIDDFMKILEIQFVDYILEVPGSNA